MSLPSFTISFDPTSGAAHLQVGEHRVSAFSPKDLWKKLTDLSLAARQLEDLGQVETRRFAQILEAMNRSPEADIQEFLKSNSIKILPPRGKAKPRSPVVLDDLELII